MHRELITWITRKKKKTHQLVLLPRDHQKSALAAYYTAWRVTKNPALTVLYISATTTLAEKQLRAIKDIFDCPKYKLYWPDMIDKDEGRRTEWSVSKICVDHPKRTKEGVRDSTIQTAGLTTNITGLHCELCILDDIVVPENAYTEEGRNKVTQAYSLLSSIESANAEELVVGTRYYVKDLYNTLVNLNYETYDDEGNIKEEVPVYEIFERVLEDSAGKDGTGQYLWPRQRRQDGRFFGFNREIRSKKYTTYLDRSKFYAQYYNDPTDPTSTRIDHTVFQYYKKELLVHERGAWLYKGNILNLYAGMDFAWSVKKKSDYTAIVVIGIDQYSNILVLDIDRFKTEEVSNMWKHVLIMQHKWGVRKLRAEVNMGQKIIVNQFRDYMKEEGSLISIDEVYRTKHEGTKMERNMAVLEPRYNNRKIWHYEGYNCQVLEEEIMANYPEHDDIEDALSSCIEIARPPMKKLESKLGSTLKYNTRFGGVAV